MQNPERDRFEQIYMNEAIQRGGVKFGTHCRKPYKSGSKKGRCKVFTKTPSKLTKSEKEMREHRNALARERYRKKRKSEGFKVKRGGLITGGDDDDYYGMGYGAGKFRDCDLYYHVGDITKKGTPAKREACAKYLPTKKVKKGSKKVTKKYKKSKLDADCDTWTTFVRAYRRLNGKELIDGKLREIPVSDPVMREEYKIYGRDQTKLYLPKKCDKLTKMMANKKVKKYITPAQKAMVAQIPLPVIQAKIEENHEKLDDIEVLTAKLVADLPYAVPEEKQVIQSVLKQANDKKEDIFDELDALVGMEKAKQNMEAAANAYLGPEGVEEDFDFGPKPIPTFGTKSTGFGYYGGMRRRRFR